MAVTRMDNLIPGDWPEEGVSRVPYWIYSDPDVYRREQELVFGGKNWNYVALTQHILGVRPELGGLRVAPCLPGSIETLEVTRHCRGAEYRITVKNQGTGKAPELVVDGKPIEGTLVPWAAEGSTVVIDAEL